MLDIALPPQWANLASLTLLAFIGAVGAYALFRAIRVSVATAVIAASLFILNSWFGLHYAEGHIPYGVMQLLPWVLLAGLQLEKPGAWLGLASLLTFMVVDGGSYAFIFSIALLAALAVSGIEGFDRRSLLALRRWPMFGLALALGSVGFAGAKLFPVVVGLRGRVPQLDRTPLPLGVVLHALFDPGQKIILPCTEGLYYQFHEFGCYLGFTLAGLLIWALRDSEFRRSQRRLLVVTFFFFWTAVGWGNVFNPWSIFRLLPLFNQAHVQSRLLVVFLLLLLIVVARALDRLRARTPRWTAIVVTLLLVEALVARTSAVRSAVVTDVVASKLERIPGTVIAATVQSEEYSYQLSEGGFGSSLCYEPAFMGERVRAVGSESYQGELHYSTPAPGRFLKLREVTPGRLGFEYSSATPEVVILNHRYLGGWTLAAQPPGAKLLGPTADVMIQVSVPPGTGAVWLDYQPRGLPLVLGLWGAGCFGFLIALGIWRAGLLKRRFPGPRPA